MKNTKLLLGKKNTGKTTGVLFNEVEDNIKNNSNILFLDSKEEYYRTYCEKLKNENYEVLVLNLKDPQKSNNWNPLTCPYKLYKSGKIDLSIKLIKDLAITICKEDAQSDPFWGMSAGNYLSSLILILFENAKETEINLGSLGLLLRSGEKKIKDEILIKTYLDTLEPLNPIYVMASGTAFAPYETRASIISVVRQKLNDFLIRESLINVLNSNDVDLLNNDNKKAIFIITEEEGVNSLANILINQISKVSENVNKFTFVLDNLEFLKPLNNFKNFIESAEQCNYSINVAFRNKNKFEDYYGKYAEEMFDEVINTDGLTLERHTLGNYNEYPISYTNKINYFVFEKIMENHIYNSKKSNNINKVLDDVSEQIFNINMNFVNMISNKLKYDIPRDFAEYYSSLDTVRIKEKFFEFNNSEKIIQTILSMDETNKMYILKYQGHDSVYDNILITFAILEFGDSLCFNRNTNEIMYYNHEDDTITPIANNWNEFYKTLYVTSKEEI